MKRWISPRWTLNYVFDLRPEMVKKSGFRALIVDVDNTLVAWDCWEPTLQAREWVNMMRKADIQLYLLSNNTSKRVASVADPLELPYLANALKPRRSSQERAISELGVPRHQILVIGDQLMTDIVGANRAGMDSVLVKPIAHHDIVYTRINRAIEKLLLRMIGIKRQGDWGSQID